MSSPTIHAINVFDEPIDTRTREDRFADTAKRIITYDPKADNSVLFRRRAPMSFGEELTVVVLFLLCMGGPMFIVVSFFGVVLFGTWSQLLLHIVVTLVLAYHPMPSNPKHVYHPIAMFISRAVFKYFSYRFMWTGDALQDMIP